MPQAQGFSVFLVLFLTFSPGGAYYLYVMERCQFSSSDGHDAVLLDQFYYNKILEGQYNSTVGKVTAYTEKVEPYVWLRSVKAEYSQHQQKLVCSAYDFYPKKIRVTWLRDGKEVTSDVTSTDELPNGNWLYQIHSYLEFTPKPGEKIACMVEHASLKEPQLHDWEPESDSKWSKIAVGSAGLLLGLLFSAAGFIYYKTTSNGRVVVPTTEDVCPEETL
ncbi:PREDICTED: DLA class II histocompatibility antigen, DR-1 beta chain-like isoform X2 [Poecilia mexicana]|uniref:DLA class II histocompatibility antigen, DR-1 beta chain-like isoform X2 n=1 Tax=Poecilia mexicana TaxID=48701 RepID=UPI00072E08BF|nr:PREDICTED: DLA class II histocompatibility antigen, DR-1 beta chain-like isoform X2 [Poecilia mexicana]